MNKVIVFMFCILLIGCELKIDSRASENADDYGIRIVYLEDGTRCATFKYGKGISCDWSNTK